MTSNILSAFNDHFYAFVHDIQTLYPDDIDIASVKNYFFALRKINPKLIITAWNEKTVKVYHKEIEEGNISFFLEKDYSEDLNGSPNTNKILEGITRLRDPIKLMGDNDKGKAMKYIQNLTKLCNIYYNK